MSNREYIIRAGDFYVAAKTAADMSLAMRDWEFQWDGDLIEGYQLFSEPIVYQRKR